MSLKDQILQILVVGRELELEFIAGLTDAERAYESTYEKWSAKDAVAHANYWQDVRASRARAWIEGEEFGSLPQFEQANYQCYERFAGKTWAEIEEYAEQAHEKMQATIQGMSEEVLEGPSEEAEERKMWEMLIGSAFTHKLMHYADFYYERGQQEAVSRLWGEWADLVSPLDDSADWQSRVGYNAACSLALVGNQQAALEKLRKALDLQPQLRSWSRRDTDLASLHDLPEYKELVAPVFWWKAIEAGPLAEALADQFLRALSMFRFSIEACPEKEWRQGETLYQRPAGLALHIAQSVNNFSMQKPGEQMEDPLNNIQWQVRDADKLPSQKELLRYLGEVEKRMANLIVASDLTAEEEFFPWTGFTILSRVLYALRHMVHHLADLIMELKHRGVQPPSWH